MYLYLASTCSLFIIHNRQQSTDSSNFHKPAGHIDSSEDEIYIPVCIWMWFDNDDCCLLLKVLCGALNNMYEQVFVKYFLINIVAITTQHHHTNHSFTILQFHNLNVYAKFKHTLMNISLIAQSWVHR